MADFPRQEDLVEKVQALEIDIASRTRKPRVTSVPTPQGVSELLSAISKLEKRDGLQLQSPRTRQDGYHIPSFSSTLNPRRVAEILDSLASVSVSQPKQEVIAIALRLLPKAHRIEIIVSGNAEIPSSTLAHLKDVWVSMKSLSDHYYADKPPDPQDESPQHTMRDPDFKAVATQFTHRCLEFSFSRLQHKVNAKFQLFMNIPTAGLDPKHPFHSVRKSISTLERLFTRKQNAIIGKPQHDDVMDSDLHICLRDVRRASDQFLHTGGFQGADKGRNNQFLKLDKYLQKINSIYNNIEILMKTAVSPRCRNLFTLTLKIVSLPKMSGTLPSIAADAKDWERVLEIALSHHNHAAIDRQVLDLDVISQDTRYMAQEAVSKNVVVHCETKLLVAIEKSQEERPDIPRAFTYIGVSKLSCHGCDCFFRAFNHVHGTSWLTKGSHGKSYYPWMFPPVFPKKEPVLTVTYNLIVRQWVSSYRGYRQKLVPLAPDSTAQSARSMGAVMDFFDDNAEGARAKFENLMRNASD